MRPPALSDWLDYIDRVHPKFIDMGLERVFQVKCALGLNPTFSIITVAGTNGKGSVCRLLETILRNTGYRVGCYTSPHLLRYNERVRINGVEATNTELCRAFDRINEARAETSLTYFEFGTLGAVMLFAEAGVDVAILEVGMGGRLDAVNAFDADCAVITSVDIDHKEYLGDTREQIGFEKAGIFRRGKVAVCAEPDAPGSICRHALHIGAKFMQIGRDFGYVAEEPRWCYRGLGDSEVGLPYPNLRGAYQLRNASACMAVLEHLKGLLPVRMADIHLGLEDWNLPGRFQVLPERPQVVLDVAHNPHAASVLAMNLRNSGSYQKTFAICAMLRDKDIAGVIREIRDCVDVWLVAGIHERRGATAEEVVRVLEREQVRGAILPFYSPAEAYVVARNMATDEDRIVVFGSFHTVAEILRVRGRA